MEKKQEVQARLNSLKALQVSPLTPLGKLGRTYQKGDAMQMLRGILASRLAKKKEKPLEEVIRTPQMFD